MKRSRELQQRAERVLVGGVNSPVRSFKRVGIPPLLAARGAAEFIWDVDEKRYIDLVMSYGPHLFGHAHPKIISAVKKALDGSSCLGMSSELEIEWAETLLKRLPGADKVRAMSTGTEACMSAIRLARGITKRDVVVKCAGHYHGHGDSLLMDSGSGVATLSHAASADSAGIPAALTKLARVVEFNDIQGLENLFAAEGAQIACMILEPIMGNMGVVPPDLAFLQKARELCSQHGALLIFDEVMTGLRVGRESAQGLYKIKPDLTTLGKIVGGGMPLSALAGPAKYMDHLAPLGPVYQAGTLSGNPPSMAAGLAMLKLIDEENPYEELEAFGRKTEDLFKDLAHKHSFRVERVGSMISFYFRGQPVRNAKDSRASDLQKFSRFFSFMLDAGFMMPPSPFEACFLSIAHVRSKENWSDKLREVFKKLESTRDVAP